MEKDGRKERSRKGGEKNERKERNGHKNKKKRRMKEEKERSFVNRGKTDGKKSKR